MASLEGVEFRWRSPIGMRSRPWTSSAPCVVHSVPMITTGRALEPFPPVVLRTERLLLRPWRWDDIPALLPLIGSREVAATTLRIPHPYTAADAERFLEYCDGVWKRGDGARFAIFLWEEERLCGGVGLEIKREHNHAELGYWIGVPFWGKGFCTEAAQAVVRYGFNDLKLNRIHSGHFSNNPASGSVLRKLGMKPEGILRRHIHKWDEYLDIEVYGLLASEYKAEK